MDPPGKIMTLLYGIDEVIGVGGSCHCRFLIFVVLFVLSSRRNFWKSCGQKKGAKEGFDDKIN
jgi:hypothetical protein